MNARVEADRLIDRNGWALAWVATVCGVAIIAAHIESRASRFSAASWHYALQVPGSPATWGVVILTAGLLLLYGASRDAQRACHAGFLLAFLWFCGLDAAAFLALSKDMLDLTPVNRVNPLSVVFYTYLAWMYGSRMRLARRLGP